MKKTFCLLATLALLLSPIATLTQEKIPHNVIATTSQVLEGLKRVRGLVESLPEVAKEVGLTREDVQKATELRLLEAGVKVIDGDELLKIGELAFEPIKSDIAILHVQVHLLKIPNDVIYASEIDLSVKATGIIGFSGRAKRCLMLTIWQNGQTGYSGKNVLRDGVIQVTKGLVEAFLLDYLKANPKK